MTNNGVNRFSGITTDALRATTQELVAELVRRIDAGKVSAEEVCRRLNVSSIDELLRQLGSSEH